MTSLSPNNITVPSGNLNINLASGSSLTLSNNTTMVCSSVSCSNELYFGSNYFQNYGGQTTGMGVAYYGNCFYISSNNLVGNIPNGFLQGSDNARYGYLANNGGTGVQQPLNYPWDPSPAMFGLFVCGRVCCGDEIDVVSDIRAKNNILDISSENSLHIIRNLQPKTFNYIDKPNKSKSYGFVAQDVDSVFGDCITKIYNFIPNICQYSKIIDKTTITFLNFSTGNLIKNSLKIKVYVNNSEKIVTIKEIINDTSFSINEDLSEEFCFVYGQEVDDFHVLEKNAIFTLTTSAVKQLDIELQETKKVVEMLKAKLAEFTPLDI